jgi:DNA-binding FrmR family transcriptional regulator
MQDIKIRIYKIKGQLTGIEKMIDNKRSCDEVIQQILAVKKAIDSLAKEISVQYLASYLKKDKKNQKRIESILTKLIRL